MPTRVGAVVSAELTAGNKLRNIRNQNTKAEFRGHTKGTAVGRHILLFRHFQLHREIKDCRFLKYPVETTDRYRIHLEA